MSSASPRPNLLARLSSRRPARPLVGVRRLAGLVLALVVLAPIAAQAVPIEDFPGYEPQTRCSPDPKPGTVALSKWLMKKYPGSGSLGISRGCGSSGTSEHKEGRAFDWAVNVKSARDRGYVKDFFAKILAPDSEGNPAALARRMGIMYLIWNDHIYASYRGFAKRDYTHSSCRKKKAKCSATLRHRNHVHISLSRAGGAGETSWYHRDDPTWQPPGTPTPTTPPTPPAPTDPTPTVPAPSPTVPTPAPVTPPPSDSSKQQKKIKVGKPVKGELRLSKTRKMAKVKLPLDGSTYKSKWKLRKGKKYKVTVAGVVAYGAPDRVGDAACVWSAPARSWVAAGTGVKVDGSLRFGRTCATDHVYSTTYIPRKSRPLRVKLASPTSATTGKLVLLVSKKKTDVRRRLPKYPTLSAGPAALASTRGNLNTLAETVQVPAAASSPVLTTQEVEQGARYRLTVSGVVDLGRGVQTDGQCIAVGGTWYQSASLDLRTPDADHGNLYVNGQPFDGESRTDCSSHTHVMTFTAAETRRLQLMIWDPYGPSGNSGELTVTVQRLTSIPTPKQVRGEAPEKTTPWTMKQDVVDVNVAGKNGTVSTMRLKKGQRVTLSVSGTYTSHGVTADATCVGMAAGWASRDSSLALEQDPLELWVDGELHSWGPCNDAHTYSTSFVVDKSGPLRLAVMDLDFRDNVGNLTVTLTRG